MVKRAGGALVQNIVVDPQSTRTISSQITTGLRKMILNGGLMPGERLPASRTLATELGVARSTVVEAFEQLTSEGLLESRIGAGSFVSQVVESNFGYSKPIDIPAPKIARPERLARLMDAATSQFSRRIAHEPRPFTTAMPAFDAFPMAQWSRIMAKHWRKDRTFVLGYNDSHGLKSLRQAIAQHLRTNRGVACDWTQVFIFAGAQQAFQLIAEVLLDPGDKVWFENPGAIGARNCFVIRGSKVVPVPVDSNGIRVDIGLERAPDFRLAFTTPAHQQPTGAKLSYERRLALLQAAGEADAWIVEDDWDGDFSFQGRPQPALKSLDKSDRVVYVGTFSKSLYPSLRIGYLVSPLPLVTTFEMAVGAFLSGVPTCLQATVAEFMEEGHFASHIRRMRKLYAERHDALIAASQEHLEPWLDVRPTTIGLHTVGYLKRGLNAADVTAAAAARDITLAPMRQFSIEPLTEEALVIGFSGTPVSKTVSAVKQLAEIFRAMT
jgi:GntR family transcriptional regulator/MocR family aminotransferase